MYELQKSYKNVLTVLQNAASVKEASDYVVKKYERPANQSDAVLNKRAAYGEEFFKEYVLKEEEKMQTGKGLAEYAKSKLGTPYFYGAKLNVLTEKYMEAMHKSYPKIVTLLYMAKARNKKQVGKVNVDCSGLIAGYRKRISVAPSFVLQPRNDFPFLKLRNLQSERCCGNPDTSACISDWKMGYPCAWKQKASTMAQLKAR